MVGKVHVSGIEKVDSVIRELANFDLTVGESSTEAPPSRYLEGHRHEYVRTVQDVVRARPVCDGRPRVLEIGAFFGVVSIALSRLGYDVTAADIPEFIEIPEQVARYARDGVTTKGLRLEELRLPIEDENFDVVIMCEVLEHLNFNPLPLLKEINRILVPGGIFYLSLPNFARTKNRMLVLRGRAPGIEVEEFFDQLNPAHPLVANGHWREYTMGEIRKMLEPLGFKIDRHYYFSFGETQQGGSIRKGLGRLFYRMFPSLKENQTAIAIRERRTEIKFTIPSTVHPSLTSL